MRKIREIVRLRWELGLKERATTRSCKVSRSTVGLYLKRAQEAGLKHWKDVESMGDRELDWAKLSGNPEIAPLIENTQGRRQDETPG